MKKIIIIIAAVVLGIVNANGQLKIRKAESVMKEVATISAYQIWLYQDSKGYYLAANSNNQFDENFFWLPLGKNRAECLESIGGLISIANGEYGDDYYAKDNFGGELHIFKGKSLFEKIIVISDTEYRYAGTAQISIVYLNRAKKWFEENGGETASYGKTVAQKSRPTILGDLVNHENISEISALCKGCGIDNKQALQEIGAVYAKIDTPTPEMEIALYAIGYTVKKLNDDIIGKIARGEKLTETDYLKLENCDRAIKGNMIKLNEI